MKFDDIFEQTGGFGTFQVFAFLCMVMFNFWHLDSVHTPFIVMQVDHACHITELENLTFQEQQYIGIPQNEMGDYQQCHRFAENFSLYSPEVFRSWNRSDDPDMKQNQLGCDSWVYDTSQYTDSAVIRYNLVCAHEWLVALTGTVYFFGAAIGSILFGIISDKHGRLTSLMISHACAVIGTFISIFAPNFTLFTIGRILTGLGRPPTIALALVYILEVSGKRYHSLIGLSYIMGFGFGYCILPWLAMGLKSDIYLQLAVILPTLLYFSYWWLLPESPRWLLVQERYDQAEAAIRKIARMNKKKLDDNFDIRDIKIEELKGTGESKTILHVFGSHILRRRIIVVLFLWFSINLQYHSVTLNIGRLPGDIYFTTFLVAVIEIAGDVCAMFVTNWRYMGRRRTVMFSMLAQGTFCLISVILQNYSLNDSILLVVILLARMMLNMSYGTIYFYTPELFPTEVRSATLGAGSMLGRIGGMLGSFVGGPMADIWWALPSVIYTVLGIAAGVLCIFLPETLGVRMCDTIEEVEGRGMTTAGEMCDITDIMEGRMKTNDATGDMKDREEEKLQM